MKKLYPVGLWQRMRRGRRGLWLAGLALLCAGLLAVQPVRGAIELAYFRATPGASNVLLEWATLSEYNVAGFEILSKPAGASVADYHPIGSRIAQGNPQQGGAYSFNVTSGLTYGKSYCFRLREVTTDETPGEQFDLCGYGPGVTPVPQAAAVLTPTLIIETVPGVSPAPTLLTPGVILPAETPTPFPAPFGQPTPTLSDPFASPLLLPPTPFVPEQPFSPLPTPFGQMPDAGISGVATELPTPDPNAFLAEDEFALPADTPFPPAEPPTMAPAVTDTPTFVPTETATFTPEQPSPLAVPATDGDTVDLPTAPAEVAESETGVLLATPTPLYVVVTATPTPDALAAAPPTFTPWPTPAPTPGFELANLFAPSSQNLMVMLLCLIFLSASGLGVLGLVTSVIYMRSQASRDRLPAPYYGRRRY